MATLHGRNHGVEREPDDQHKLSTHLGNPPRGQNSGQDGQDGQDSQDSQDGQDSQATMLSGADDHTFPPHRSRHTRSVFSSTSWTPPIDGADPNGSRPLRAPAPASDPTVGQSGVRQPPGDGRGPTAPAAGTEDDEEDELQFSVTTRMARLSHNPAYLRIERLLANRRRARARLSGVVMFTDVALSLLLVLAIEQFKIPLSQVVTQVRFLKAPDALVFAGIVLFVWPVVFSLLGLYRSGWVNNIFAPLRAMITVGLGGLAVSGILYFFVLDRMRVFWLTFVLLDALLLALARLILRPLARLSAPRRRILIIGTGRLAIDAARAVSARSAIGLEIIGVVGPEREFRPTPDMPRYWQEALYRRWVSWRLGDLRDAPRVVREKQVDLVLIALSPRERYETSWLICSLANLPVQLYVMPDVVTETAKTAIDEIDGIPVIGLAESAISGWNASLKRMMDLAICVPLLVLTAPLMLAIGALVRLDSPGPALFRQERIGQHNRRFIMLKFRTMLVDAEQHMKAMAERTATQDLVHKRRDDPSITRVGAFLRRTSLDELPQLINILKGDMSVVGPRPELPWIVERYRAWQYRRLLVPQGLTGWWQVNGRSNRVLHLHTQDDIFYVRNYSLWLDLKILLMTVKVVLTGHGAF